MKNKLFTLFAALMFAALFADAQAPQGFNYQAVVRNGSGNILSNQSVEMRFSIRSGSATGTVQYQESKVLTTNEYGLVSHDVGTGTLISGNFNNITWNSGAKFLQVEANTGSGFTSLGAQKLMSVPFALESDHANTASTATTATNATTASTSLDNKWATAGNNIYNNNTGSVGIGTNSPIQKLDVNGRINVSAGTIQRGGSAISTTADLGLYSRIASNWMRFSTNNADIRFYTTDADGVSNGGQNAKMVITAAGDVGIGNTGPDKKLVVSDSDASGSRIAKIQNYANSGSYNDGLEIEAGNSGSGSFYIAFVRPGSGTIGTVSQAGGNSVAYNTTSDSRLKTNISDTKYGLNTIMNIEVKDYNFKNDLNSLETGFIAQQLYEQFPNAVTVGGDDPKDRPWMVDYGRITPVLVKAIQEQQAQIENQESEIELLKKEIESLKSK